MRLSSTLPATCNLVNKKKIYIYIILKAKVGNFFSLITFIGPNNVIKNVAYKFLTIVLCDFEICPRLKILIREVQPSRLVVASNPFIHWFIIG